MSEHDEQVSLFQFLKTLEPKHYAVKSIYAIPNGGLRKKGVAGKLKAEGAKSGVLDIHCPMERNGHIGLWVEMKFGRNKLTDNQVIWKRNLEELGHKVVICYNWIDAANEIMRYLGIKGEVR